MDSVESVHTSLAPLAQHRAQTPGTSQWGRAEGKDPLPPPAADAILNAAQGAFNLLCSGDTLLFHGQLGVHWDPSGLLYKAAFQPTGALVYSSPGEGSVFPFSDLHEDPLCPFSPDPQVAKTTTAPGFFVVSKLSDVAIIYNINKNITWCLSQNHHLWYCITDLPPAERPAADDIPLISVF